MKITILNFSSRKNGNCDKISQLISYYYKNEIIERINFFDLNISPCGKCNYECFKSMKCPMYTDDLLSVYDLICKSELCYMVIPNYCDYPCANFFIFNERSSCFFQGKVDLLEEYENVRKKFIVVSNTDRDNFRKVLSYHTSESPNILFLSAKDYESNSIEGNIMKSEHAKKDLLRFIEEK